MDKTEDIEDIRDIRLRLLSGDLIDMKVNAEYVNKMDNLKLFIEQQSEKNGFPFPLRKHRMNLIKNEDNEYMVYMNPIKTNFINIIDENNDENNKIKIVICSVKQMYDLHDWLLDEPIKSCLHVSCNFYFDKNDNNDNNDLCDKTGRLLVEKMPTSVLYYKSNMDTASNVFFLQHFHHLYELSLDFIDETILEMIRKDIPSLQTISVPFSNYFNDFQKNWSSLFASTSIQTINITYERRDYLLGYNSHLDKFKNHLKEWVEWDYSFLSKNMIKLTRYSLSKYGSVIDINYIDPCN